mgnify:CR=1 FL=1
MFEEVIIPSKIHLKVFEEIQDYFRSSSNYGQDVKHLDKLRRHIESASSVISKGEAKLEALMRQNQMLKTKLDSQRQRRSQSLEYWKDYGLEVRSVPTDEANVELYEFVYKNLRPGTDCLVGIRVGGEPKQILIYSQNPPDLLSEKQLSDINSRLSTSCIGSDGNVEYKLAMILIRKELKIHSSAKSQ